MTHHVPFPDLIGNTGQIELAMGAARLSFPAPDSVWLSELAQGLRHAPASLETRATAEIVAVLDALNARWADSASPERREADALLAAVTGYPLAVIGPALDHLFAGLRAPHLEATLAEELGHVSALDEWIERPALGAKSRAFGPRLTLVVASGNVPMPAIPSIVYALLLKSPVLVKLSSDEPVLAGLYLRSLAAADAEMGRASAAVWWSGGDEAIEAAVLPHAEVVVAFGGEAALASLAARLAPGVRFQPHGHRIGFGVVARERLTRATLPMLAGAVARDVAEFDQQGCVAPHRLFVERGGEVMPHELAGAIAESLAARAADWPRLTPSAGTAAAIHQFRAAAEVRATLNPKASLFASAGGTDWTVVVDPEPGFGPGCLFRTVTIHPLDDLERVPALVAPYRPYLQTVTAALTPERHHEMAECLARAGVSRLCPTGRSQRPAPGWRPDGRPRLAELVRWVDWEEE